MEIIETRHTTIASGLVHKLKGRLLENNRFNEISNTIQYSLPIGDKELALNPLIGKSITFISNGQIQCIACGRNIKKSYQQGYCFPCTQTLARCDLCIVKPERCHYRFGTCREPEWAKDHCMIPHVVYIANTSGLKVGITRETQIPTRWIDQGAIQALPIARVQTRYLAGLVEVALAKHLADKTDWRKMLKGNIELVDLEKKREEMMHLLAEFKEDIEPIISKTLMLQFPVLEYPLKVQSLSFEKTKTVSGILLGIKGQYLILDIGVINIRNVTGYHLAINT